ALVRENDLAHGRVVLPQHAHDLLRLGGLGEGGEATQVEEHDDDLAPVALERIVGAAVDDRLGERGREEALEPREPLELRHLLVPGISTCGRTRSGRSRSTTSGASGPEAAVTTA